MRSIVLTLLLVSQVTGCRSVCPDPNVKLQVKSPDGVRVATVYEADCGGATTRSATIVNLHVVDQGFQDGNGDLLNVDGNHDVKLRWLDPKRLEIECDDCIRKDVYFAVAARHDVNVLLRLPKAPELSSGNSTESFETER